MSAITLFTVTGRVLLAAAVANGQALASAKLAVGDGNGQVYVPNENQTALVHETWRGAASVARTDDLVVFQATIPANVGDFVVREVGLFLGPAGSEQLFIISQSPSREKIATPANGGAPMTVSIHFSANAAQVAVLPAGGVGVSILQLENAPHITVDALVTAPPANPVDGSLYAIGNAATGLFTGMGQKLVERVSGAWVFRSVRNRSVIRLKDTGDWYEKTDAGWVVCPFNDTAVSWTELTGKPATFAPDPHTHDYLPLTGGNVTGPVNGTSLTLSATLTGVGGVFTGVHQVTRGDNGNAYQINHTTGGTVAAFCPVAFGGGNYGLGLFGYATATGVGGYRWVSDHMGRTCFGGTSPTERVDVVGNIALSGAIKLASGFGTANQVPISAAGGANTWANVIDLISATQLRAKIGGQTVWAAVHCWGAKPANGTVPANFRARGCAITTNEFSSGNPLMVVTFAAAAPDTSYIVVPDGGAVSAKTTTGFSYALGNLSTSAPEITVYL